MVEQTYQEVSKEILEEFQSHKKELTGKKVNYQDYFFKLRKKKPKRFEALFFNENGHKPFSEDLENILIDLQTSGFLARVDDAFYLKKDLLRGYWLI
jgi:hypothetical protein